MASAEDTSPPGLHIIDHRESSSSSSSSTKRSSQSLKLNAASIKKRFPFVGKCAKLVRERRARFYIMRRCLIMLLCWRQYRGADS